MDLHCIHCSELVEAETTVCRACGGNPRARDDIETVDLNDVDPERSADDLVAGLVAGYGDAEPHQRPHFGENMSTELEIELEPIRIGTSSAGDVLPAQGKPRRPWRR